MTNQNYVEGNYTWYPNICLEGRGVNMKTCLVTWTPGAVVPPITLQLSHNSFLRNWILLIWSRNLPSLMEPKVLCWFRSDCNGLPYPGTNESSPHPPNRVLWPSLILATHLRQGFSSGMLLSAHPTRIPVRMYLLSCVNCMPCTQHPLCQILYQLLSLLPIISFSWSNYSLTTDSVYVKFVAYRLQLSLKDPRFSSSTFKQFLI
jgi:hypothetical protein